MKQATHNQKQITMTTLEGNKLIAEFDDCVSIKPKEKIYKYEIDGDSWALEGLKYHSSWDWLMPVIEKMEKIDGHFTIGTNKIDYQYKGFGGSSRVGFGYTKVRCVWEVVIQFIQWYNSQPKNVEK